MKPRILHLSADYPDSFQPAKTSAIAGLVEGTADQFQHFVVSLNRQGGAAAWWQTGRVLEDRPSDGLLACRYAAPPAALAAERAMTRLADELAGRLTLGGFRPDLIQGHKLTIEGFAAARLAKRLGVPYVLTLQGNTDQKLIRHRPDRVPALRQIWAGASGIMAFAPWTADWCEQRLGSRVERAAIIPCILPHDDMLAPEVTPPLIRTAFNLDFWRNKNIKTLLAAMERLTTQHPAARLEIAGGGTQAAQRKIGQQIARAGLSGRAELVGPIAPRHIQKWLNGAAVFALPSRRESFGMVFAEALLAGVPVVYPRGAAIDGYFPDASFARAVAAKDVGELAQTLAEMLAHPEVPKADLASAQRAGKLNMFKHENVLSAYIRFLERALR